MIFFFGGGGGGPGITVTLEGLGEGEAFGLSDAAAEVYGGAGCELDGDKRPKERSEGVLRCKGPFGDFGGARVAEGSGGVGFCCCSVRTEYVDGDGVVLVVSVLDGGGAVMDKAGGLCLFGCRFFLGIGWRKGAGNVSESGRWSFGGFGGRPAGGGAGAGVYWIGISSRNCLLLCERFIAANVVAEGVGGRGGRGAEWGTPRIVVFAERV